MKANVLLADVSANREKWLSLRKGKISASIIPAVVGLSRYKSRLELWAEFTGKVEVANDDNDYMALGRTLEPYIGNLFSKRTGLTVKASNKLYQHPEMDWAIASPDFEVVGPDGTDLLECKSTNANNAGAWGEDNCPDEAHLQLIWQLGVCCGPKQGWVAGLVGGDPRNFFYPRFDFAESVFSQLIERASQFLDFVRRDVPPDPGPGDSKLIEKLIGDREGALELEGEKADRIAEMLLKLAEKKEEKSCAEKVFKGFDAKVKEIENQIKLELGSAASAIMPDGRLLTVKSTTVQPYQNPGYSYTSLRVKATK